MKLMDAMFAPAVLRGGSEPVGDAVDEAVGGAVDVLLVVAVELVVVSVSFTLSREMRNFAARFCTF